MKNTLFVLLRPLFLVFAIVSVLSPLRAAYTPPAAASLELNFNPGWRVAQGSFPVVGVDDSGWERISTPHTYHERQSYQGLKKGLRDLGAFTYRKHFTVPADYAGRKLVVEFQGIRQRGQFYLNGQLLGRVSDGVTPFGYDLTPYVKFGAENTLHAEIDCADKEFGTDTAMCWFFPGFNPLYGGIGRNVTLHVLPKVHATLPLYSSFKTEGTYVYAENISTEKLTADIGVEVQVRNDEAVAREVECRAVVVDHRRRREPHVYLFEKRRRPAFLAARSPVPLRRLYDRHRCAGCGARRAPDQDRLPQDRGARRGVFYQQPGAHDPRLHPAQPERVAHRRQRLPGLAA